MSIMNSSEAVRMVLDEAAAHIDNVLVIYVEPDQAGKPLSFSRRLTLPENEEVQLPFAVGCAQAGALVVLDLHAIDQAAARLEGALRALNTALPPMVIRLRERVDAFMPGIRVLSPANPRELAAAMRYALQSGQACIVAENPLGAYEACEVPDNWDELFDAAPQDECLQAEDICPEEMDAEDDEAEFAPEGGDNAAPEGEADEVNEAVRVPGAAWGSRSRLYQCGELERTAALLGLEREELRRLCCQGAMQRAEVVIEADAAPGECALLPPREGDACLWVGADHASICWRTDMMTADEARALLSEAVAMLELPVRLILNKGM